tara:strand:- start:106 stop:489 length:384 start_codon:yes stop_codon:yes gene_type:complete
LGYIKKMKKLLAIVVLVLLWSPQVLAKEDVITIQCQSDDPNLAIFKPIYIINLKTKSVKVGASTMQVVKFSDTEIILGKVNPALSQIMKIDRLSGRYEDTSTFYGETKEQEKKIVETGICIKKEKAF